jgi:adenine-specific DNA-methyltransferase
MPTLNWTGKSAVVEHHKQAPFHLLRCKAELSVGEAVSKRDISTQNRNLISPLNEF